MTVVDESDLGSYFHLTPRPSLEVPPPLQSTTSRSASDGNIFAYKELLNLHQKRNSWPFATVFPGFHPLLSAPDPLSEPGDVTATAVASLTGGPPPLAKIASTTITSTTSPSTSGAGGDQPMNLSASSSENNSQKRRPTSQINNPVSTPPVEADSGDVLDLSAKPPYLGRLAGASPGPSSRVLSGETTPSTSTTPFVPPKAHSRPKLETTKFCRLCSREIELTLIEASQPTGLCLSCQQRTAAAIQPQQITTPVIPILPEIAHSLPVFPGGNLNPLAAFPGLVPGFPAALASVLPLELANALAARSLLPGVLNPLAGSTQANFPNLQQENTNSETERRKCDSIDPNNNNNNPVTVNQGSPSSSFEGGNREKTTESPSSAFFCAKCNINFRSAKSLEAHLVDYCQQTGQTGGRKGTKRRSVDASAQQAGGQDLVCQLCGYHGHSERGIRVHFNAMHSIGSEIQLEQYLTTMIVRADPSTSSTDPLKPENAPTPSSKKRRFNNSLINSNANNTAAEIAALNLLDLAGIKVEPASTSLISAQVSKKRTSASGTRGNLSSRGNSNAGNSSSNNQVPVPAPSSNNINNANNGGGSLRRQPPFECRLCSKTFPDTAKLRLHMRSHEKDESIMYSCKRCNNFTTPVKSDLVRHVKIEHEGVNMRLSTWTIPRQQGGGNSGSRDEAGGKSSSSSNELTSANSDSSDDGPTFCDICQISFRFKHSYEAHRQYYCMAKWTDSTNTGAGEDGSGTGSSKFGDGNDEDDVIEHLPGSSSSNTDDDQEKGLQICEGDETRADEHEEAVEDLSSSNNKRTTSSTHNNNNSNEIDENSSVDITS